MREDTPFPEAKQLHMYYEGGYTLFEAKRLCMHYKGDYSLSRD